MPNQQVGKDQKVNSVIESKWETCLWEYCQRNRIPIKDALKLAQADELAVYNSESGFDFTKIGWVKLSESAKNFLIFKVLTLEVDTKFELILGQLGLGKKFAVSEIHVEQSFLPKLQGLLKSGPVGAQSDPVKSEPSHWEEKRMSILSAALQIISDSGPDQKAKIWHRKDTEWRLNATAIADELNDKRAKWKSLRDEPMGTSHRNIVETIRKALTTTD